RISKFKWTLGVWSCVSSYNCIHKHFTIELQAAKPSITIKYSSCISCGDSMNESSLGWIP
ncbi:MAG: hypothetical protein WB988_19940, partial [Candidatus Nitrosopolaris sp.]